MTQTGSKNRLFFMVTVSTLMAFTSLSTDIYLPAMPVLEKTLDGNAELTVTGFLIGFAIAQLVWGPVSDRVGRKIPLFLGIIFFIVGSVGCALSETMTSLILFRVLQAVGACVGPMLSRAMIRDLYDRSEAASMLSTLMMIMAAAPILGPLLGGWFLTVSTWHAIFWFMVAVGIVMALAVLRLPETLPAEKRSTGSLRTSFANYAKLLGNRTFAKYTLCITLFYTAIYAFITGSSFVYIDYYKVPEQYYGFLFGVNILGVSILSFFNKKLVKKYSLNTLVRVSAAAAALGATLLLATSLTGFAGIWGLVVPIFIVFSTNGILAATTNALALDSVAPSMTGSAAALLGSLQYGSGIISSLLLTWLYNGTPRAMVEIIFVFVVLSALVAFIGRREPATAQAGQ